MFGLCIVRTFPTAASPSSTSFTLLLGFGAAFAESAIALGYGNLVPSSSAQRLRYKKRVFEPLGN